MPGSACMLVVEFSELIFIYVLIKLLAKPRVEDICLGSQLLVGTRYIRGGARDELYFCHRMLFTVVSAYPAFAHVKSSIAMQFDWARFVYLCKSTHARFTRCQQCALLSLPTGIAPQDIVSLDVITI